MWLALVSIKLRATSDNSSTVVEQMCVIQKEILTRYWEQRAKSCFVCSNIVVRSTASSSTAWYCVLETARQS